MARNEGDWKVRFGPAGWMAEQYETKTFGQETGQEGIYTFAGAALGLSPQRVDWVLSMEGAGWEKQLNDQYRANILMQYSENRAGGPGYGIKPWQGDIAPSVAQAATAAQHTLLGMGTHVEGIKDVPPGHYWTQNRAVPLEAIYAVPGVVRGPGGTVYQGSTKGEAGIAKSLRGGLQEFGVFFRGPEVSEPLPSAIRGEGALVPEWVQHTTASILFSRTTPEGTSWRDPEKVGAPYAEFPKAIRLPQGAEPLLQVGQVFQRGEEIIPYVGHPGLDIGAHYEQIRVTHVGTYERASGRGDPRSHLNVAFEATLSESALSAWKAEGIKGGTTAVRGLQEWIGDPFVAGDVRELSFLGAAVAGRGSPELDTSIWGRPLGGKYGHQEAATFIDWVQNKATIEEWWSNYAKLYNLQDPVVQEKFAQGMLSKSNIPQIMEGKTAPEGYAYALEKFVGIRNLPIAIQQTMAWNWRKQNVGLEASQLVSRLHPELTEFYRGFGREGYSAAIGLGRAQMANLGAYETVRAWDPTKMSESERLKLSESAAQSVLQRGIKPETELYREQYKQAFMQQLGAAHPGSLLQFQHPESGEAFYMPNPVHALRYTGSQEPGDPMRGLPQSIFDFIQSSWAQQQGVFRVQPGEGEPKKDLTPAQVEQLAIQQQADLAESMLGKSTEGLAGITESGTWRRAAMGLHMQRGRFGGQVQPLETVPVGKWTGGEDVLREHLLTQNLTGLSLINEMTAEQLQELPGIGPSRAQQITQMRGPGGFRSVGQLADIRGISEKMIGSWSLGEMERESVIQQILGGQMAGPSVIGLRDPALTRGQTEAMLQYMGPQEWAAKGFGTEEEYLAQFKSTPGVGRSLAHIGGGDWDIDPYEFWMATVYGAGREPDILPIERKDIFQGGYLTAERAVALGLAHGAGELKSEVEKVGLYKDPESVRAQLQKKEVGGYIAEERYEDELYKRAYEKTRAGPIYNLTLRGPWQRITGESPEAIAAQEKLGPLDLSAIDQQKTSAAFRRLVDKYQSLNIATGGYGTGDPRNRRPAIAGTNPEEIAAGIVRDIIGSAEEGLDPNARAAMIFDPGASMKTFRKVRAAVKRGDPRGVWQAIEAFGGEGSRLEDWLQHMPIPGIIMELGAVRAMQKEGTVEIGEQGQIRAFGTRPAGERRQAALGEEQRTLVTSLSREGKIPMEQAIASLLQHGENTPEFAVGARQAAMMLGVPEETILDVAARRRVEQKAAQEQPPSPPPAAPPAPPTTPPPPPPTTPPPDEPPPPPPVTPPTEPEDSGKSTDDMTQEELNKWWAAGAPSFSGGRVMSNAVASATGSTSGGGAQERQTFSGSNIKGMIDAFTGVLGGGQPGETFRFWLDPTTNKFGGSWGNKIPKWKGVEDEKRATLLMQRIADWEQSVRPQVTGGQRFTKAQQQQFGEVQDWMGELGTLAKSAIESGSPNYAEFGNQIQKFTQQSRTQAGLQPIGAQLEEQDWQKSVGILQGHAVSWLNTAGVEDLQRIRGIGPARAQQIVQMRGQGRIQSIGQLSQIRGISQKMTSSWSMLDLAQEGAWQGAGGREAVGELFSQLSVAGVSDYDQFLAQRSSLAGPMETFASNVRDLERAGVEDLGEYQDLISQWGGYEHRLAKEEAAYDAANPNWREDTSVLADERLRESNEQRRRQRTRAHERAVEHETRTQVRQAIYKTAEEGRDFYWKDEEGKWNVQHGWRDEAGRYREERESLERSERQKFRDAAAYNEGERRVRQSIGPAVANIADAAMRQERAWGGNIPQLVEDLGAALPGDMTTAAGYGANVGAFGGAARAFQQRVAAAQRAGAPVPPEMLAQAGLLGRAEDEYKLDQIGKIADLLADPKVKEGLEALGKSSKEASERLVELNKEFEALKGTRQEQWGRPERALFREAQELSRRVRVGIGVGEAGGVTEEDKIRMQLRLAQTTEQVQQLGYEQDMERLAPQTFGEQVWGGAKGILKGVTSGFGLMQMRRYWGMTGGAAFGAIPAGAAQEQAYIGAAMAALPASQYQPSEIGMEYLTMQAQKANFQAAMGQGAFQAYGGFMRQGGRDLGTLAGIGLPAIGAGLIGAKVAEFGLTGAGLSAAAVGTAAPLIGLGVGAVGLGIGAEAWVGGELKDTGRLAVASQQGLTGGGVRGAVDYLLAGYRAMPEMFQRMAISAIPGGERGAESLGWTFGQIPWAEQRERGARILGGNLAGLSPEDRVSAILQEAEAATAVGQPLSFMSTEAFAGQVAAWSGLTGEENVREMYQDPRRRGHNFFAQVAYRGGAAEIERLAQAAMARGMAPGRWEEYAGFAYAVPSDVGAQEEYTYNQWAGLTNFGIEGMDIARQQATRGGPIGELNAMGRFGMSQMLSGNRFWWSQAGQELGIDKWQTVNTETGMGIGTNWGGAILGARAGDTGRPGQNIDLSGGNVNIQVGNSQVSIGFDQWSIEDFATTQARGFEDRGMALRERGLTQGYNYTMASWDLETRQREAAWAQQATEFGFQARGLRENDAQFTERWNVQAGRLGWEEGQWGDDYAERQRRRQVQFGWQIEDIAFQGTTSQLQFGWQMEDLGEAERFATGRDRRQIQRKQERASIMFGLGQGQLATREERIREQMTWGDLDATKEKERHDQQVEWRREDMEMQKRFHEQDMSLAEDRLANSVDYFETTKKFQIEQTDLSQDYWLRQHKNQKDSLELDKERLAITRQIEDIQLTLTRAQQLQMAEWLKEWETGGAVREVWTNFMDWLQTKLGSMMREMDEIVLTLDPMVGRHDYFR